MAVSSKCGVELGFVEDIDEKWKLLSQFFPSKVGGKPAWLVLKPLPDINRYQCGICNKPCVFLLQVYAPFEDKEQCFHRTIFMFVCRNPACSKRNDSSNIKAFRSQLGKRNDFYSSEPPDESHFDWNGEYPKAENYQSLCWVCGCFGEKRCSGCHQAAYCSKHHQIIDWKAGHKLKCGKDVKDSKSASIPSNSRHLFPEYELVTEAEEESIEEHEKTEAEKMEEYRKYLEDIQKKGSLLMGEDASGDLENMATGLETDKQFFKFKKRVALEPDQVLRYQRGGQPLWVSAEHVPSAEDIPKCSCGAPRTFEFQVMPQLLYHLKVDDIGASLDWGTLAVFTCSESCQPSSGYQEEFVWKQDFSSNAKET